MQGYFDALRARMLCRVATLFDVGLQEPIHTALATLPLRGVKPMLMQQPLRDLDQIRAFMSSMGPTAFLDMPWIPIFLIALFLFHPAIGMTALLGTAAIIAMTLLTERHVARRGQGRDGQQRPAAGAGGCDPAQCRNHPRARHDAIGSPRAGRSANERYLQENIRATDVYANLGSGAKVLRYVLQSGMLGIGAYLVVADKASGGIMIASSIMMGRALAPVEVALGTWKQLVAARQGIDAAARHLQGDGSSRRRRRSRCRVRAASFRCRISRSRRRAPSKPIVSDVSFSLKAGTGLALLGRERVGQDLAVEGAGRHLAGPARRRPARRRRDRSMATTRISAAISAICRRMSRCSTAPSRKTSAASMRTRRSDAILQGRADRGRRTTSSSRLPEGYSTRIGEGGMSLSAGQRQRIGLARAVFGDPFLVVLDEPNANLDADGENALTRAIQILRQNRSIVIVISHRPSALAALNMAMVLYEGKAIAFGPCEEIFARVVPAPDGRRRHADTAMTRNPANVGAVR